MAHILIVEDDKVTTKAIKLFCGSRYDLTIVESAEQAAEQLDKCQWNVIISDQKLPGITGAEFLTIAMQQQPDATRVLMTGYNDIQIVIYAVNKGHIYHYLNKPFSGDALLEIMDRAVADNLTRTAKRSAVESSLSDLRRQLDDTLSRLKSTSG